MENDYVSLAKYCLMLSVLRCIHKFFKGDAQCKGLYVKIFSKPARGFPYPLHIHFYEIFEATIFGKIYVLAEDF